MMLHRYAIPTTILVSGALILITTLVVSQIRFTSEHILLIKSMSQVKEKELDMKQRFITKLSHEMKTPLHIVTTTFELMQIQISEMLYNSSSR